MAGTDPDYQDAEGTWHVMCACGHRVTGTVRPGDRIALCPNCRLRARHGEQILVQYEDRLPGGLRTDLS